MTSPTFAQPVASRGSGRRIPWWMFAAVLAGAGLIVVVSAEVWGTGVDGRLHAARYTARLSFFLFVTVFAAGAIAALFPSPATRWLRRQRRYLGLSFALAHYLHLAALTSFFVAAGEAPDTVTIVLGGLAFLLIALMALTSNDRSMRVLGPRAWRALHLAGAYYVWLVFMNSYLGRALGEAPPEPRVIFVITVALGFAAAALRAAAWLRRRSARGGE